MKADDRAARSAFWPKLTVAGGRLEQPQIAMNRHSRFVVRHNDLALCDAGGGSRPLHHRRPLRRSARAGFAHHDGCALAFIDHALGDLLDRLGVEGVPPLDRHLNVGDVELLLFEHRHGASSSSVAPAYHRAGPRLIHCRAPAWRLERRSVKPGNDGTGTWRVSRSAAFSTKPTPSRRR